MTSTSSRSLPPLAFGRTPDPILTAQPALFGMPRLQVASGPAPMPLTPAHLTTLTALVHRLLEVINGQRTPEQFGGWVTGSVQADLRVQQALLAQRRDRAALRLVSVGGQSVDQHIIEAHAHLRIGQRSVPMAFRLTRRRQRWWCTAWELGPIRPQPQGTGGPPGPRASLD